MTTQSNFAIIPYSDYVNLDEATKTRYTLEHCEYARWVLRRAHNRQTLRMLKRLVIGRSI